MNLKERTSKITNIDKVFYIYLLAMLTLIFLRNVVGINIPVYFLLLLTLIPAFFGSNDHIIATAVCCIPMSIAFQFKYALLICIFAIILKQSGKIRINRPLILLIFMMVWELLHLFYGEFSIIEYYRNIAELLFLMIFLSINLKSVNYRLIFRAFSFVTVSICFIMLYLQMKQHGFRIEEVFGQGFRNFRFGQANTTAVNYGLNINPNRLGFICNLSTTSILMVIKRHEKSIFDLALLLLSIIFGLMTLSRTYVIILMFIVIFYIIILKGTFKQKALYIGGIVATATMSIFLIRMINPTIFENLLLRFKEEDLLGARDHLFVFYNKHIFSSFTYFFFGIGLQSFKEKINSIYNVNINVPHNGFQEIWVAWGIVGFILFILMFGSLIKEAKRYQPNPSRKQYLILFIMILHVMAGQLIRSEISILSLILVVISLSIDNKSAPKIRKGELNEDRNSNCVQI